jgi:phosphoribosylformimino-5-aminoimidazole carboxamide ribotide isomerase
MLVIPAIDLSEGQVVRLKRGDMAEKTVYSDDPPAMARRFEAEGAEWLHVVDLDAATGANHHNAATVQEIARCVGIPVQLGGGLRSLLAVERALSLGVKRAVIGTIAAEKPDIVREAVREFCDGIAVAIDARDGFVAVRGWTEATKLGAVDFARQMEALGVSRLICTDIASDGMLTGPNLPAMRALAEAVDTPIIASGGISSLEDVRALKELEPLGVEGCITGRAVYAGSLPLAAAIELARS